MKLIYSIILGLSFSAQTFCQCLDSEQAYKDYFTKNITTLDPIEGIWSGSLTEKVYNQYNDLVESKHFSNTYQCAIIADSGNFKSCFLGNKIYVSSIFIKTAMKSVYLYQSASSEKKKATTIISDKGLIEYSYEVPKDYLFIYVGDEYVNKVSVLVENRLIKLFPTINDIQKSAPSSGTGFAISSDGIIVTNHHVVNEAININVRGVNGDFSKTYKAKVVADDKNNDLAIIKIDDNNFTSSGTVPYVMTNKSSDVGSSIFCLGYPLRATMGDEVKLTNGIISSKSGFQGDITSYQISAPVQPGNSGGPLFDDKGSLIGIINAKHLDAENVSYAVKISYLLNLIDIMPTAPKLQTVTTLSNKTLSEQVKIIKNFTYVIETN